MAIDLEPLLRTIDELPIPPTKREAAKAELFAAFALVELVGLLVARVDETIASLARVGALPGGGVAEHADLGDAAEPSQSMSESVAP